MKKIYQRMVAIFIMCIPGIITVYGLTLIKDVCFNFFSGQRFAWLSFVYGLLLLLFGLTVIGGFIFHHDKKRNRIKKNHQNK